MIQLAKPIAILIAALTSTELLADKSNREPVVWVDSDGRLAYAKDEQGNRIPDFSFAGYRGGGHPIPLAPTEIVVSPGPGDDGDNIQIAIDYVSRLPIKENGIRGAVLLEAGRYEISKQLRIRVNGVVLRGEGPGIDGTILVATGHGRRPLIELLGKPLAPPNPKSWIPITSKNVPVNSNRINVPPNHGFKPGDTILIKRASSQKWIDTLGMGSIFDRPSPVWKPNSLNVIWEREIVLILDETLTVDAPLTCSISNKNGGGFVAPYSWPNRLRHVGIENLRCVSEPLSDNALNEEHSWIAISMENVEDAWVSDVTAKGFVGSAINILESSRRVTIQDCQSLDPISEIAGYRRHSFYSAGQQTLFLRCQAEEGRHDFALGWLAAGPNAFVHCESQSAHDFSGPIESWVTGALYDNLVMDGGGLRFDHREIWDNGVGWTAANCMAWQCTAPIITAKTPPGANNWIIGCWAQFSGDAIWRNANEFVAPDSLYEAQLLERKGNEAKEALSKRSYPKLNDQKSFPTLTSVEKFQDHNINSKPPPRQTLSITNGWLTINGSLLVGNQPPTTWWRGHASPNRASEFGPHLTRFTPGRTGPGITDSLDDLTTRLQNQGAAALRHHWGLWYDRRRDDHQMIRRINGEVWPPFYEQPWARSGIGRAWDGLSKYDLTQYNPWYFDRLREFAVLCESKGIVFINAMYFQHNLLEAGAHWADFPWRSANNINETGFPEPPPYVRKKRIFMAKEFYDTSHPKRRELHRAYIRQCLKNLAGKPNALHVLGEEFTGPTHFVEFWINTIAEWESETGQTSYTVLSAPKDVQDAILDKTAIEPVVDVIDFKYWWLSPKGLFAPNGDQDMAPRQHERLWKGGRPTDETVAQMVGEYRTRFPKKAIITSFPKARFAYLCAGGSMPNLPSTIHPSLLKAVPHMKPWLGDADQRLWILRSNDFGFLAYSGVPDSAGIDLSEERKNFSVYRVFTSGQVEATPLVMPSGQRSEFPKFDGTPQIFWLRPIGKKIISK